MTQPVNRTAEYNACYDAALRDADLFAQSAAAAGLAWGAAKVLGDPEEEQARVLNALLDACTNYYRVFRMHYVERLRLAGLTPISASPEENSAAASTDLPRAS